MRQTPPASYQQFGWGGQFPAYVAPPSNAEPDGMDLFRKLWRRKGLIVIAAVVGVLLASGAAMLMTPRYTAETRLMVGIDMPNVANIPMVLREQAASEEMVQSESYVLTSRSLATRVADRLQLENEPEFNPALSSKPAWKQQIDDVKGWAKDSLKSVLQALGVVEPTPATSGGGLSEEQRQQRRQQIIVTKLLSRLDVEPMQRSHVVAINAQSEDPEMAARIANTVAQTYMEQQVERRARVTEDATTWLDGKIADLREKVEKAEQAVEEYRREHGLFETRNDNVTAQQLTELNSRLVAAESDLTESEARLAQVKKVERNQQPVSSLPSVVNSPLIQALLQRQVEAERRAAELGTSLGPEHPQMKDIQAQLADIKTRIDREVAKVVEAQRHEVEAVRARVQELRGNLQQLQSKLGQDNEKAIRLHELQRQAEANRQLLVSFLERQKEAEAQPNATEQSATVISEAAVPLGPSFPPTTMLRALGLVGGALIGMVAALMMENFDRTFRTRRQVEEATGLPVLGVLPSHSNGQRSDGSAGRRSSLFRQAIGNLYERLVVAPEARRRKVVMLTSATPQEGKSQIARALLGMAARSGQRTIVLDCDWRRPTLHRFFSTTAAPGLGDLLAGEATSDEAVHRDPETGLHAIFAGNVSPLSNSTERFERLRLLLATLARHYDLVIVDTPPVMAGPDARILGRMMDQVAFVVRWGQASSDVVVDAIRDLTVNGAELGGVILSDVNTKQYRRYGMGDALYSYPSTERASQVA